MLSIIEITPLHWAGFILIIIFFLALDLGVFHRKAHVVKFKEALGWTLVWFSLAMLFAAALVKTRGPTQATEYVTGYLIELSLSMDNVFVIALIFSYFRVPAEYQHRVLFWGILGALIMRGVMIGLGAALIAAFHWILYVFGLFLIYSGVKMIFVDTEGVHPEKNPVIRLARKLYPVCPDFQGQKFFAQWNGKRALTPLAIVLIMVETTDLIFALDSIPAIFGITEDPFIVFTSNVFAILGLRSLYFVLAGAIQYFKYLKIGLSIVLVFIGVKMIIEIWHWEIGIKTSLLIVVSILLLSMIISIIAARREARKANK
ncbi:MAG TPA: TerC family protein [Verrucomicrobiae bacterium]|nr:TerC family protein [Verrucomicrobiae bacterium]